MMFGERTAVHKRERKENLGARERETEGQLPL